MLRYGIRRGLCREWLEGDGDGDGRSQQGEGDRDRPRGSRLLGAPSGGAGFMRGRPSCKPFGLGNRLADSGPEQA